MKRKSNALVEVLLKKSKTLALAESVTCGLAAHKLGLVKGISEVFLGSVVCYNPCMKQELLGVSKSSIDKFTAESKQVTAEMARKLSRVLKADVYAAVTGLSSAGGTETPSKPVGTVFFAVYYKNKLFHQRKRYLGASHIIKNKACNDLYSFIKKIINN